MVMDKCIKPEIHSILKMKFKRRSFLKFHTDRAIWGDRFSRRWGRSGVTTGQSIHRKGDRNHRRRRCGGWRGLIGKYIILKDDISGPDHFLFCKVPQDVSISMREIGKENSLTSLSRQFIPFSIGDFILIPTSKWSKVREFEKR